MLWRFVFGTDLQPPASKAKKTRSSSRNGSNPAKPQPIVLEKKIIDLTNLPPTPKPHVSPSIPSTSLAQPAPSKLMSFTPKAQEPKPVLQINLTKEEEVVIRKHLAVFAQQNKLSWDTQHAAIGNLLVAAFDSERILDKFLNQMTLGLSKYPSLFEKLLGIKHQLSVNKFLELTFLRSALRTRPESIKLSMWLLLAVNATQPRYDEILRSLVTSTELKFITQAVPELERISANKSKAVLVNGRSQFGPCATEFAVVQYIVQSTTAELAGVIDHAPGFSKFCSQIGVAIN